MRHSEDYDFQRRDDCMICHSKEGLRPLYHPPQVSDGERGTKFTVCTPCYVYAKSKKLDALPVNTMISRLMSRSRRKPAPKTYNGLRCWHLGLTICYDDHDNVACAEDSEGFRYDAKEVQKYFDNRAWLIGRDSKEVESWCQEHLADHELLNLIVSNFSS